MIAYKYVTPERKNVLENGNVRFTQPAALNDPFEALTTEPLPLASVTSAMERDTCEPRCAWSRGVTSAKRPVQRASISVIKASVSASDLVRSAAMLPKPSL